MTGADGEAPTPFTMLGAADAQLCDGDVCVVPDVDTVDIEPSPEEAAAASARAVTAALDEGSNL